MQFLIKFYNNLTGKAYCDKRTLLYPWGIIAAHDVIMSVLLNSCHYSILITLFGQIIVGIIPLILPL